MLSNNGLSAIPVLKEIGGAITNSREINHIVQKPDKSFQAKQEWRKKVCVQSEGDDHKSTECKKVTKIGLRRKLV